jgi:hypothetical protein
MHSTECIILNVLQRLIEYPEQAEAHFRDIKEILNREGSDYKN